MNRINRAILNEGKKYLIRKLSRDVLTEICHWKEKIEKANDTLTIDILNTGLLLNVRAAQKRGLEFLEYKLRTASKNAEGKSKRRNKNAGN